MEEPSRERAHIGLGNSILVPSVQELAKDQSLVKIPSRYERLNQEDSLNIADDGSSLLSVPVIDLERLVAGDPMDSVLEKLHSACIEWGFFQVVKHGVSSSLLEGLQLEIEKFFKLPYEQKKELWQQPGNQEGFGQSFVISQEQKLDWSDMFGIITLPPYLRNNALFDQLPPNLRETLKTYCIETKKLGMEILSHMAKALKMDIEEMKEQFNDGFQVMRMNYYPPCPEPKKAIGFTPHSDADALTILFQLNETDGLQIRKDGRWVPIKPLPNAFVVNVGDMMEIMSNGVYRSIEHRATVNSTKERLSIATFYTPKLESVLGPAGSLIGPHSPPMFRQVPIRKYLEEYFARKLNGKSYVDYMRIPNPNNI
ncbi:probable 2-oxoglutarate/Fe(II)-dependent dioxygenase [Ricinus communis]|uniref:probable 2-oxoglutarate/Fe(II)-dependent dioxygenase n=1 Tax=Ricinus communis TaxID=3988 RepID=UPI00201ADDF7|nr:probable 2-oxoglutarate/Fe(II)-dependent dioxygenase [Ricinus communis]